MIERRKVLRAKPPAVDLEGLIRALERKVRRVADARRRLEKRLIAAVQEIGSLRHFELRATQLEEDLRKREAELAGLRANGAGLVTEP